MSPRESDIVIYKKHIEDDLEGIFVVVATVFAITCLLVCLFFGAAKGMWEDA